MIEIPVGVGRFFAYARERERTRITKTHVDGLCAEETLGGRPAYTTDPILQRYRFCNVFREDDRTTRWIRQNVTADRYQNSLLGALYLARWFNRIETLERLVSNWNLLRGFGTPTWADDVRERLRGISPIVTGAYIVKTPPGLCKLDGILDCSAGFLLMARANNEHMIISNRSGKYTLQRTHTWLQCCPYMGPFMAYEVVTDLRHTPLLDNAPDIMTWASAGPGAARGLQRVFGGAVLGYNSQAGQQKMNVLMGCLLAYSRQAELWPWTERPWEMREVEHTLCEFDKYERVRLGEGTPKQLYRPKG